MKLTFSHDDLVKLMADGETTWPNGVRDLYGEKKSDPGFWLVGDQGLSFCCV